MTRINVIDPADLSNEHLMAEYRELPRIFTHVKKHGIDKSRIPAQYTLGKGHVLFFTDKLEWLINRFVALNVELIRRGYNVDNDLFWDIRDCAGELWEENYASTVDYQPTPEDKYLNMARLVKRCKFDAAKQEMEG